MSVEFEYRIDAMINELDELFNDESADDEFKEMEFDRLLTAVNEYKDQLTEKIRKESEDE